MEPDREMQPSTVPRETAEQPNDGEGWDVKPRKSKKDKKGKKRQSVTWDEPVAEEAESSVFDSANQPDMSAPVFTAKGVDSAPAIAAAPSTDDNLTPPMGSTADPDTPKAVKAKSTFGSLWTMAGAGASAALASVLSGKATSSTSGDEPGPTDDCEEGQVKNEPAELLAEQKVSIAVPEDAESEVHSAQLPEPIASIDDPVETAAITAAPEDVDFYAHTSKKSKKDKKKKRQSTFDLEDEQPVESSSLAFTADDSAKQSAQSITDDKGDEPTRVIQDAPVEDEDLAFATSKKAKKDKATTQQVDDSVFAPVKKLKNDKKPKQASTLTYDDEPEAEVLIEAKESSPIDLEQLQEPDIETVVDKSEEPETATGDAFGKETPIEDIGSFFAPSKKSKKAKKSKSALYIAFDNEEAASSAKEQYNDADIEPVEANKTVDAEPRLPANEVNAQLAPDSMRVNEPAPMEDIDGYATTSKKSKKDKKKSKRASTVTFEDDKPAPEDTQSFANKEAERDVRLEGLQNFTAEDVPADESTWSAKESAPLQDDLALPTTFQTPNKNKKKRSSTVKFDVDQVLPDEPVGSKQSEEPAAPEVDQPVIDEDAWGQMSAIAQDVSPMVDGADKPREVEGAPGLALTSDGSAQCPATTDQPTAEGDRIATSGLNVPESAPSGSANPELARVASVAEDEPDTPAEMHENISAVIAQAAIRAEPADDQRDTARPVDVARIPSEEFLVQEEKPSGDDTWDFPTKKSKKDKKKKRQSTQVGAVNEDTQKLAGEALTDTTTGTPIHVQSNDNAEAVSKPVPLASDANEASKTDADDWIPSRKAKKDKGKGRRGSALIEDETFAHAPIAAESSILESQDISDKTTFQEPSAIVEESGALFGPGEQQAIAIEASKDKRLSPDEGTPIATADDEWAFSSTKSKKDKKKKKRRSDHDIDDTTESAPPVTNAFLAAEQVLEETTIDMPRQADISREATEVIDVWQPTSNKKKKDKKKARQTTFDDFDVPSEDIEPVFETSGTTSLKAEDVHVVKKFVQSDGDFVPRIADDPSHVATLGETTEDFGSTTDDTFETSTRHEKDQNTELAPLEDHKMLTDRALTSHLPESSGAVPIGTILHDQGSLTTGPIVEPLKEMLTSVHTEDAAAPSILADQPSLQQADERVGPIDEWSLPVKTKSKKDKNNKRQSRIEEAAIRDLTASAALGDLAVEGMDNSDPAIERVQKSPEQNELEETAHTLDSQKIEEAGAAAPIAGTDQGSEDAVPEDGGNIPKTSKKDKKKKRQQSDFDDAMDEPQVAGTEARLGADIAAQDNIDGTGGENFAPTPSTPVADLDMDDWAEPKKNKMDKRKKHQSTTDDKALADLLDVSEAVQPTLVAREQPPNREILPAAADLADGVSNTGNNAWDLPKKSKKDKKDKKKKRQSTVDDFDTVQSSKDVSVIPEAALETPGDAVVEPSTPMISGTEEAISAGEAWDVLKKGKKDKKKKERNSAVTEETNEPIATPQDTFPAKESEARDADANVLDKEQFRAPDDLDTETAHTGPVSGEPPMLAVITDEPAQLSKAVQIARAVMDPKPSEPQATSSLEAHQERPTEAKTAAPRALEQEQSFEQGHDYGTVEHPVVIVEPAQAGADYEVEMADVPNVSEDAKSTCPADVESSPVRDEPAAQEHLEFSTKRSKKDKQKKRQNTDDFDAQPPVTSVEHELETVQDVMIEPNSTDQQTGVSQGSLQPTEEDTKSSWVVPVKKSKKDKKKKRQSTLDNIAEDEATVSDGIAQKKLAALHEQEPQIAEAVPTDAGPAMYDDLDTELGAPSKKASKDKKNGQPNHNDVFTEFVPETSQDMVDFGAESMSRDLDDNTSAVMGIAADIADSEWAVPGKKSKKDKEKSVRNTAALDDDLETPSNTAFVQDKQEYEHPGLADECEQSHFENEVAVPLEEDSQKLDEQPVPEPPADNLSRSAIEPPSADSVMGTERATTSKKVKKDKRKKKHILVPGAFDLEDSQPGTPAEEISLDAVTRGIATTAKADPAPKIERAIVAGEDVLMDHNDHRTAPEGGVDSSTVTVGQPHLTQGVADMVVPTAIAAAPFVLGAKDDEPDDTLATVEGRPGETDNARDLKVEEVLPTDDKWLSTNKSQKEKRKTKKESTSDNAIGEMQSTSADLGIAQDVDNPIQTDNPSSSVAAPEVTTRTTTLADPQPEDEWGFPNKKNRKKSKKPRNSSAFDEVEVSGVETPMSIDQFKSAAQTPTARVASPESMRDVSIERSSAQLTEPAAGDYFTALPGKKKLKKDKKKKSMLAWGGGEDDIAEDTSGATTPAFVEAPIIARDDADGMGKGPTHDEAESQARQYAEPGMTEASIAEDASGTTLKGAGFIRPTGAYEPGNMSLDKVMSAEESTPTQTPDTFRDIGGNILDITTTPTVEESVNRKKSKRDKKKQHRVFEFQGDEGNATPAAEHEYLISRDLAEVDAIHEQPAASMPRFNDSEKPQRASDDERMSDVSESTRERRRRRRSPPVWSGEEPPDLPRDRALTPPPDHNNIMDTALGVAAGLGFGGRQSPPHQEPSSRAPSPIRRPSEGWSFTRLGPHNDTADRDSGVQFDSPVTASGQFAPTRDSGFIPSPAVAHGPFSLTRDDSTEMKLRPPRPQSPTSSTEDLSRAETHHGQSRHIDELETPRRKPSPVEPASKDRSSALFNSSPAAASPLITNLAKSPEPVKSPLHRTPSIHEHHHSREELRHHQAASPIHRSPSIHGHHHSREELRQQKARAPSEDDHYSSHGKAPTTRSAYEQEFLERSLTPGKRSLSAIHEDSAEQPRDTHHYDADVPDLATSGLVIGAAGLAAAAAAATGTRDTGAKTLGRSKSRTSSLRNLRGNSISLYDPDNIASSSKEPPLDARDSGKSAARDGDMAEVYVSCLFPTNG
jgi:hypothetical protein